MSSTTGDAPDLPAEMAYDRAVLVEVLVYHWRKDIQGCGCGWGELGRSWPEHVATVYEESVAARAVPAQLDVASGTKPGQPGEDCPIRGGG